jgi:hypothetical protein
MTTSRTHHQLILGFSLLAMVAWSWAPMNSREMSWPALWSHETAADPTLAELRHRANMSLARLVEAGQIVEW